MEKMLSELVIERLSLYHRCVKNLKKEKDSGYTDSSELSQILNIDPSLIRRDLSLIGKFGKRGMGYSLNALVDGIEEFLGKQRSWKIALVGIGNLGTAILHHLTQNPSNYSEIEVFDHAEHKIGTTVEGISVQDVTKISPKNKIQIAILTIPAEGAQKTADHLISNGVQAILSFAPISLSLPKNIFYREIDLFRELDIVAGLLSYFNEKKD